MITNRAPENRSASMAGHSPAEAGGSGFGARSKSHIDVSSALRTTVSESYSNLVTRPTGAAVRTFIEQQLQQCGDCAVAVIDFTHVGMMDFSCADEIVAKLVLRQDDGADHAVRPKIVFGGLSEAHLEAIDVVLERHGMALVSHEADMNTYIAAPTP